MPKRAEDIEDIKEKLEQFRSFPLDESLEEKVESLWREHMGRGSHMDADLSEAKARKAQAQFALEQAELDTVRKIQIVCQRMRAEGERELEEARGLKEQAARDREEAQTELHRAQETRTQAERERAEIIARAEREAREISDQARNTIQQETTEALREASRRKRRSGLGKVGRGLSDLWRRSG